MPRPRKEPTALPRAWREHIRLLAHNAVRMALGRTPSVRRARAQRVAAHVRTRLDRVLDSWRAPEPVPAVDLERLQAVGATAAAALDAAAVSGAAAAAGLARLARAHSHSRARLHSARAAFLSTRARRNLLDPTSDDLPSSTSLSEAGHSFEFLEEEEEEEEEEKEEEKEEDGGSFDEAEEDLLDLDATSEQALVNARGGCSLQLPFGRLDRPGCAGAAAECDAGVRAIIGEVYDVLLDLRQDVRASRCRRLPAQS
jgi:hypothetical protein